MGNEYLGEFEHVVMVALARLGEAAYGMTVYEEIVETTGREASVPSVYVTLGRLEKKGYVTSRVGDPVPERGGRAKKYFSLTSAGVEALELSRALFERLWEGVDLAGLEPRRP